jgi:predicted nuclease of predicted toxin-antitoxin system
LKILLDENMPHKLRAFLPGHEAITVAYLDRIGVKNGELIKAAEAGGFDVLVTSDQGIPHQQNMTGMKLALVVLSTPDWNVVKTNLPAIAAAVNAAAAGSYTRVDCGRVARPRFRPKGPAPE